MFRRGKRIIIIIFSKTLAREKHNPLARPVLVRAVPVVGCKIPRKRKLADFLIYFRPHPLPVSPGSPEVELTMDKKTSAPKKQKIGLIETLSRVSPKKGKHAPGN